MTKTLVSLDLDWLNDKKNPLDVLEKILRHILKKVPATVTIQHHEFLPDIHRWVKLGRVPIPFNILQIDEHHDYYNTSNFPPDCGNWGYHIPPEWYRRLIWIRNTHSEFCDWDRAKKYFDDNNISFSVLSKPHETELKSEIVAAIFCVSPDYLNPDAEIFDCASEAVDIIAHHFGIRKIPEIIDKKEACAAVDGWQMAPRLFVRK